MVISAVDFNRHVRFSKKYTHTSLEINKITCVPSE